jgi:hypothetical protein
MGHRRTRVERQYNPHVPQTITHLGAGQDHHAVVYGTDKPGSWSPPFPHAHQRAGLGDDPHSVVYMPAAPIPSVLDQIEALVARSRGQY